MRLLAALSAVCVAGMLSSTAAVQAAPPADFQTSLVVASGLDGPTSLGIAPDGRIFILERSGKVKIVKDGELLAEPFVDLPSEATGDRGLLGIAFDPDFGVANHYVYFHYVGRDLLHRVVRFDASSDLAADGPRTIFETRSLTHGLHAGGAIGFGPDGKLYLAIGDNGYPSNAQDLSNPFGKILRINKDGSIPADNPFYGQVGKDGAIWAYGLRNPWQFQFDSATGDLYDGDVGEATWEELNRIVKGGNYGWPLHEGACTADCAGFIDPIYAYRHDGQSSAVAAGPVYRGSMFPEEYQGRLFFGDYARGFLKTGRIDGGTLTDVREFDTTAGSVVDLKVAGDGSLYYLTYDPAGLYRVTYDTGSQVPVAKAAADKTSGGEPLEVHFSSAGSGDPDGDPITYHWDFGDGTTSTEANPVKRYPEPGAYSVHLTVSDGQSQTVAEPIVIQVGTPPTLTVSAPEQGMSYRAGHTVTYRASATDAAGTELGDEAIKTEVRLHHGTHFHPFVGPLTGREGTFTIPTTGEVSADTWYEIIVTATDAEGLSTTKSVEIYPLTSQLNLATVPPGLGLRLDGVPVTTPFTVEGVVGFHRELSAPATAVADDGTVYHFTGWSDGAAIRHVVTTPETDVTYTATYAPSAPFTGEYFDNKDLSGSPVLTRRDPRIDFLWGEDAPDSAVPADGFSVRWSKTAYFVDGRYRFTATTDDGVRLYLDGRLVIDEWHSQSGEAREYVVDLAAGEHTVTMEYFDDSGPAAARLTWDTTSEQPS